MEMKDIHRAYGTFIFFSLCVYVLNQHIDYDLSKYWHPHSLGYIGTYCVWVGSPLAEKDIMPALRLTQVKPLISTINIE